MSTKAIGIRVPVILLDKINERAACRDISFNKWVNWALAQGIRSYKKKPQD